MPKTNKFKVGDVLVVNKESFPFFVERQFEGPWKVLRIYDNSEHDTVLDCICEATQIRKLWWDGYLKKARNYSKSTQIKRKIRQLWVRQEYYKTFVKPKKKLDKEKRI